MLHRICEAIGLPSYVKTTGKTGLHILLPLGRQFTYAQSRTLGELLARVVLRELGDIATITRHVTKRGDKVYLDYLQNRHGQLIVAPFSVRPLPGATVSMPLAWDEVNSRSTRGRSRSRPRSIAWNGSERTRCSRCSPRHLTSPECWSSWRRSWPADDTRRVARRAGFPRRLGA